MFSSRLFFVFFLATTAYSPFAASAFKGFYIGAGAGGSFLTAQENVTSQITVDFPADTLGNRVRTTIPVNVETSLRDNSAVGALYAGYGVDINYLYLGAEAFVNFAAISYTILEVLVLNKCLRLIYRLIALPITGRLILSSINPNMV